MADLSGIAPAVSASALVCGLSITLKLISMAVLKSALNGVGGPC